MLKFIPILATLEENSALLTNPDCRDTVHATTDYYKTIGFNPPWIGYIVMLDDRVVGSAGYKGKPVNNKIEIAYGTLPAFQNKGIGTKICSALVEKAMATDPSLQITAKTLPDNFPSIAVLKKNNFILLGKVYDEDDGDVLEWQHAMVKL